MYVNLFECQWLPIKRPSFHRKSREIFFHFVLKLARPMLKYIITVVIITSKRRKEIEEKQIEK